MIHPDMWATFRPVDKRTVANRLVDSGYRLDRDNLNVENRRKSFGVGRFLGNITERDPIESAGCELDPLGTQALADALAVRLVQGVRERQRHPRFLTAMAVSLEICRDFDEDALAKDAVSEPWQVFGWYLVEDLVRRAESAERIGLRGSQKGRGGQRYSP